MFLEIIVVVMFLVLLSYLVYARSGEGPVAKTQTRRSASRHPYRTLEIGTVRLAVPMRHIRTLQRYLPASEPDMHLWLALPGVFVEGRR
jgi:hypothetical protein